MPATMTSSSNNIRIVFVNVIGITLPFTRKTCSNRQKALASGSRRQNSALTAMCQYHFTILQSPRFKYMLQYSSCLCSTIIRSQLSPAAHCVYCVRLTKICFMTITLLRNVFPHLKVTCILKTIRRRIHVVTKLSLEVLVRD